jgi:SPX domain protein involved in polyphosphate accumulation
MRFENKFVLKNHLEVVKFKQIFFKEKYDFKKTHPKRLIQNIYFDNELSESLYQNLNGENKKTKIRIRWYNNDLRNLKLEIKQKIGNYGSKKTFPIKSDNLTEILKSNKKFRLKDIIQVPQEINNYSNLLSISYNSYERNYFKSLKSGFRITVDDNLNFINLRINHIVFKKPFKIVEIKFAAINNFENTNSKVVENFNIDLSKFSKFSNSSFSSDIL